MDLQLYRHERGHPVSELFFWHTVFPATRWRQVGGIKDVTLTVTGRGYVRLFAKTQSDTTTLVSEVDLTDSNEFWEHTFDSKLYEWLWVEVADPCLITQVRWSTSREVHLPLVTVVMPTFNRETDALTQASRFLDNSMVGHVVVIDQARTLHLNEEFSKLRNDNPERLVFIQQANLGGSGGYARGMNESMRWPEHAVLNSDDDAQLPPESLRRMLVAQALAAQNGQKVVIGTAMFSAETPTHLISGAEAVDFSNFMWGPADDIGGPIDISQQQKDALPAFALKKKPNYSGWWGTLLPPGAVASVGLPAPYFIKWDDAEYGLRAQKMGYQFLTLPGVGVWHPTWGAKSTVGSWMSLPLHRNRLVTAAAYGASRKVVWDSFIHQVKHILSLQYIPAELWAAGIEQMRKGPSAWLGYDLQQVRAKAQNIIDKEVLHTSKKSSKRSVEKESLRRDVFAAVTGLIRPSRSQPKTVRVVPADSLSWRDGIGADVVVLTDSEGQITGEMRRRPSRAVPLLLRTIEQHIHLAFRWHALQREYRTALPQVVTRGYWLRQFSAQPKESQ